MKTIKNGLLAIAILIGVWSCSQQQPRTRESFNANWQFFLGDDSLASQSEYDDAAWRTLNLPHDWSVEGKFSKDNASTTAEAALPTGIGWYRKTFTVPENSKGKQLYIDFDGVFQNSKVWINGQLLGERPNGYISFRYELTPYLKYGEQKNVIAVRVDNSEQPNSRWYTGSGIYRNVWLTTTDSVHVAHWGTFVTTPEVNPQQATVNLAILLSGTRPNEGNIQISTQIKDSDNKVVGEQKSALSKNEAIIHQSFKLKDPKLWSVDQPNLYKAVTRVFVGRDLVDQYETPFGVRYFKFDAENGFFLNGKHLRIDGVCLHSNWGALGAVVNTSAIKRQLKILKEMGCNAIRISHNPPAPEMLKLCDEMGFIVMDEAFDVWQKGKVKYDYHVDFDKWHVRDLEDLILRDRNHPSVMIWSIGNEIPQQFDSTGTTIAKELTDLAHNLDPTRPVTSALTENNPEKNFIYQSGALDVLGFNYKHQAYSELPKRFPGAKLIATETASALETRGVYVMPSDSVRYWPVAYGEPLVGANDDFTASSYDNTVAYWGATHEASWNAVKNHPFMAGLFVWSGFDYLGEPMPYPWPARSSYFGIVDLAGFPKDIYYMYQSEWTDKPVLHIFPHWNWTPGQTVDVWAYYSQADEVELFLNGKSLGTKKKEGDDLHVMWRVKYEPGTLKAVSRKDGETVLEKEIKTAGEPTKIELVPDRESIHADGKDLSFVTVRILDKDGNLVPNADNLVKFNITGPAEIAGVDNGYQASLEPFKADYRKAFKGKCLVIVQSKKQPGQIQLQATSDGLEAATINLNAE
ncbi:beta-galactosidase GalB [Sunxiuqinia indica]|uniref:beta-galactosidase GalB n=1 Tax=Sunxiuqinia indica TaxID=2692584 RepID=UPI0013595160|nr:beta-galactosidase GalB [Sunxiuqinia indica]